MIETRREAVRTGKTSSHGDDPLGRILAAASAGWNKSTSKINLAQYTQWHDALQRKSSISSAYYSDTTLSRMKVLGMIMNGTLRLFPPAPASYRQATRDLELKEVFIPNGMMLELPTAALHQDRDLRGDDVGEFNPGRFENGVSSACTHPQAFAPFGLGSNFCVGYNFALMEAKIRLAMGIRRFEIQPSSNYKHNPTFTMVQRAMFGMPVMLKSL